MPRPLHLETAATVAHIQYPPMVVSEIIPEASLSLISGPTYSRKTFFALELARAVAFDTPFMGKWPISNPGNVLFIEQDSPKYDTGRALFAMLKPMYADLSVTAEGAYPLEALSFAWHPDLSLQSKDDVARIIHTANSLITILGHEGPNEITYKGTRLIIFDTLRALSGTADEDRSTEMQPIFAALRSIIAGTGAAILVVHHAGHNTGRSRGSTVHEQVPDNVFNVTPRKREDCSYVKVSKARAIQPPNWSFCVSTTLDPIHGTVKTVEYLAHLDREGKAPATVEDKPSVPLKHTPLIDHIKTHGPQTGPALIEWGLLNGHSKSAMYRLLTALQTSKQLKREGAHYALPPTR